MEKLKQFLNKHRHILAMLLIFAVSFGVLGRVGYSVLPDAASKTEREIVNDDYSCLTREITDSRGVRQNIAVKGGTKLYGVSMNFHIFNRVQHGTVFVDLEDKEGNVISSAARDMTSVLDNTFKGFIFDNMVQPQEDAEYILHIYIQPETAEDRIALWKSETDYEGFEISENGQMSHGTAALQYYTRHVGNRIYGWFAVVSLLAVLGMEILYFAVFVKKCRLETAFAIAALFMGTVFSLFTPIAGGPDEYVHMASAYKMSNDILGVENTYTYGALNVRRCDGVMPLDTTVEYNAFRFADMYEGLFKNSGGKTDMVEISARTADVFKGLYIPQAIGITLARILNMGFVQLVLMGRMFNLLFYVIAVYFAIKLMPVFRAALACCALLPMTLQLAGNFSYDTYINGISFLLIGSIFGLAYKKEKIGAKDLIVPALRACLLAPVKAIYVVMPLLIFILPSGKFKNKNIAAAAKCAVMAAAVLIWAFTSIGSVIDTLKPRQTEVQIPAVPEQTEQAERTAEPKHNKGAVYPYDLYLRSNTPAEEDVFYDPASDLMPNGDSKYYYNVLYILTHLKQTVKLVMNTVTHHSGKYLQSMIGTRLGEIIVVDLQASRIWLILIVIVLLLSSVRVKGETYLHTGWRKRLGAFIFASVAGLTTAACIMWTPINYEVIFGIQGRYFIPALPLMVMFFSNNIITLERNIDRELVYSMLPLNILVVLNVFMIMCE